MSIDSSIGYTNHPGSKARDFQLLGEQMFHHVPLRWLAHHVHLQNGGSNPNYEEYVGRPQCHSPSSYLQLCSGTHVDFAWQNWYYHQSSRNKQITIFFQILRRSRSLRHRYGFLTAGLLGRRRQKSCTSCCCLHWSSIFLYLKFTTYYRFPTLSQLRFLYVFLNAPSHWCQL